MRIADFLHGVLALLSVRAEQKGLALSCDLAADLPSLVRMDERRVRQILLNLLHNAVKFTDRGRVILRVTRTPSGAAGPTDQACLRFEIEDSGVGIDPDQLTRIFEPFEQVGDQQKQAHGTGLGLSISRQLIALMNSAIQVESVAEKGSVFWFDLAIGVPETASIVAHAVPGKVMAMVCAGADEGRRELAPDKDDAAAMLIPPQQEIDKLYQIALAGNMLQITQQGERLMAMDCRYHRFVALLNTLAQGYQTRAILALIESHMSGTSEP